MPAGCQASCPWYHTVCRHATEETEPPICCCACQLLALWPSVTRANPLQLSRSGLSCRCWRHCLPSMQPISSYCLHWPFKKAPTLLPSCPAHARSVLHRQHFPLALLLVLRKIGRSSSPICPAIRRNRPDISFSCHLTSDCHFSFVCQICSSSGLIRFPARRHL